MSEKLYEVDQFYPGDFAQILTGVYKNQLAMEINALQYVKRSIFCNISHRGDLNPRPADYESAAQPAKLQWQDSQKRFYGNT